MIQAESGFRPQVVSVAGAVGLMQVMPATARISRKKLLDPFENVSVGVAYLSYLRTYLRGRYQELNPYYLVAAYNLGPAKLDSLLAKKSFRPLKTRAYFETIARGVFEFRSQELSKS